MKRFTDDPRKMSPYITNDIKELIKKIYPLRWLPTVAGQIYIDQCGASPTGKCFEMNNT